MKKLTILILMVVVCGAVRGQEYWNGTKNTSSEITRSGNINLNNSGLINNLNMDGYIGFQRFKYFGGFQANGDVQTGQNYFTYVSNGGYHTLNGNKYDFTCENIHVDFNGLTLSRDGFCFLSKYVDAVGSQSVNELMRLTMDGNLGIGTTAPKSKLVVTYNDYSGDNTWAFTVDSKTSDKNSAIVNFRNSQANSALYVRGDGHLGLGTTSPLAKLHITSFHGHESGTYTGYGDLLLYNHAKSKAHLGATLVFGSNFENGTGNGFSTRAAIKGGTSIYGNTGAGYLSFYTVPSGYANQNTERMRIDHKGQVGIGTTTPSAKLDVAGNIKAHEIEVTLAAMQDLQLNGTLAANNITYTANGNTADFVFEDNYQLKDLSEVEAFIKSNKHLPEIPSATEMEEAGVNLAEMNKLLLMKVEELTLYSIELEKKVEEEREERRAMRGEVNELKKLVMELVNSQNTLNP